MVVISSENRTDHFDGCCGCVTNVAMHDFSAAKGPAVDNEGSIFSTNKKKGELWETAAGLWNP